MTDTSSVNDLAIRGYSAGAATRVRARRSAWEEWLGQRTDFLESQGEPMLTDVVLGWAQAAFYAGWDAKR